MNQLPSHTTRDLSFNNGTALGVSNRWEGGQYCSILTKAGIVGCGIYDLETAAEFRQAIAIAKGTPENPLVEPEDLYEAKIVNRTPKAASFGIEIGMTGREAVERMLEASMTNGTHMTSASSARPICVKHVDHVTIVVSDLDESRKFYVGVLGMREVERPGFGFPGLWFQAGPTQIHLILEHAESGPAGHSIAGEASISRTRHFAFEVEDALAAQQTLGELGVPIVAGPKSRPDGPTQLYVRDPDGHLVELFSFA